MNKLQTFMLKCHAIDYIKNNNIKDKYLFYRDKDAKKGSKTFHVESYETIYDIINNTNKAYLYEHYNDTDPAKLFLDIDYKKNNKIKFSEVLNEIINLVDNALKHHKRLNEAKIILKSCSELKHSAHIIYPNVVFESIKQMKQFIIELKSPFVDNHIIDTAVYKTGCFRLYKSSKMNVGIPLTYSKGINYEFVDDKTLFYDTLVRNINYDSKMIHINLPHYGKQNNTNNNINNTINNKTIIPTNYVDNSIDINLLRKYVFLINEKYGENFDGWIKVGMTLYNIGQSSDYFNIWHDWSKQFSSFSNKLDCMNRWNTFKKTNLTIGTIMMFAFECNNNKYKSINKKIYKKNNNYDDYMF